MRGVETLESLTDTDLVKQAQTSQAAFKVLVDRHWRRLYAFVKRLYFFEHEEVQDILQEAFIKIYRNLNGFNESFAFSTWAYQITRNCAIDALRKKRIQPQTAVLEEEEWERLLVATDESVKDGLHLEEVKRAILALPLNYREAFTLFYLEEKTYEEMIDILKKPKGTIASLINRAKAMVRQNLERRSTTSSL